MYYIVVPIWGSRIMRACNRSERGCTVPFYPRLSELFETTCTAKPLVTATFGRVMFRASELGPQPLKSRRAVAPKRRPRGKLFFWFAEDKCQSWVHKKPTAAFSNQVWWLYAQHAIRLKWFKMHIIIVLSYVIIVLTNIMKYHQIPWSAVFSATSFVCSCSRWGCTWSLSYAVQNRALVGDPWDVPTTKLGEAPASQVQCSFRL